MTQEVSMHARVQVGGRGHDALASVTTRRRWDGGIVDMFITVRQSYQLLQYECVNEMCKTIKSYFSLNPKRLNLMLK